MTTRTRNLTFCVAATVVALLSAGAAHAAEPGSSGALFLRIGMGARASGMGEAYIGVAQDASSVYWNPGAMPAVLGTNVMFMHNEYIQSVRLEQAALTHETDWGTLGLGFTGLYMDNIERRGNDPSPDPLGYYSAYDVSASIGFARYIVPNVAVGFTLKPIWEKIDDETATGFAVDVGVYHVSRIKGVKLAAVVGNLGTPMKFEQEEFALPRYIKVGGSWERALEAYRSNVLLTMDLMFPNDDGTREHVGVEYGYDRTLFLRTGYKAGYDSQGATFGAGVQYRGFNLDYGVLLFKNDLGDSHRISLSRSM